MSRHPDAQPAYRDNTKLAELRPFCTGNIHEVTTDMVRIYDVNGWPVIEVFASQAVADQIAEALNR